MFESAELGHQIDKAAYKQEVAALRADLLEAQRQLASARFSVVVIVSGLPSAGKSETVDKLLEWLDARGVEVHAQREPTDEEVQRPALWRFWRQLPASGHIGIFFGGWDGGPLLARVLGKGAPEDMDHDLNRFVEFERMLSSENVLLVKLWLHLPRKPMKKRLKKFRRDPATAWRVTPEDLEVARRYDRFLSLAEYLIRRTSTGEAPWQLIEATDKHYRNLTVGRALLEAINARLAREKARTPHVPRPTSIVPPQRNVINTLDLTQRLDEEEAKKQVRRLQTEIGLLTRELRSSARSLVLVFEGPDAAGKGGVIRRLTGAMDARDYQVITVAAPTDEERAHPYLWRFWRHLPPHGRVVLYDRSWYGRVLVERVEGLAAPEEWQRAFAEINDFEAQLTESGLMVMKFWLAISSEEQLRRFSDREITPYKQYKLTAEDWRNREKWASYEAAACEMIERTSTQGSPWVLVEAEDKGLARVKVLRTVAERLKDTLRR